MSDDAFASRSDEPASEDTAAEEPEEPMVEGSPEAADVGGDDGGGTGMLGPIELPSTGRLLVGLGGAVMALSTLLSWLEVGPDSFPNIAGVGMSTRGVGLAVFLVGLSLLMRSRSVGKTIGLSLGALGVIVVFIVLFERVDGWLAAGVWIGLAGSGVALVGALLQGLETNERPTLDISPGPAALGAVLAVVAAIWLDWLLSFAVLDAVPLNGLDHDVLYGFPVLILGAITLVLTVDLLSVPRMVMEGRRQALLLICQVAGIAITVVAGTNVLGMVLGVSGYSSGPLVALVGGVMITRSIKEA